MRNGIACSELLRDTRALDKIIPTHCQRSVAKCQPQLKEITNCVVDVSIIWAIVAWEGLHLSEGGDAESSLRTIPIGFPRTHGGWELLRGIHSSNRDHISLRDGIIYQLQFQNKDSDKPIYQARRTHSYSVPEGLNCR